MNKVESEITINASIKTVWKVVTDPAKWFGDDASIDLKVGGKGKVTWKSFGDCPLEVVNLDEPKFFAFSWISPDEETRPTNQKTLVEINLSEENGKTRLHLTESLYEEQYISNEQMKSLFGKHSSGWGVFTGNIKKQAEEA